MDRDEALRLLRGGEEGIVEWNRIRIRNQQLPELVGADLAGGHLNAANLRQIYARSAKLRGAHLHGADLDHADLSGADLRNADLREATLWCAFLLGTQLDHSDLRDVRLSYAQLTNARCSNANFGGAKMNCARLISADLSSAVFNDAHLNAADLSSANLAGADLSGTNLIRTNLSGADLRGADLSGATVGMTSFVGVDLARVKNLETLKHDYPSHVDIDTLYASDGRIPEAFLRGCGVPNDFIPYIPSLAGKAIEFYSCFISYSHEDKLFARRLHDQLQGRGIRCWLDEKQMFPGDNIYGKVEEGIRLWDKVLLCASKFSLTSGWVDDELKHAFAKEKQLYRERGREVLTVIPLNLDGYLFSGWQHPKKNQVIERVAPDFQGWEQDDLKFEEQLERVIRALRTDSTARDPPPESKL